MQNVPAVDVLDGQADLEEDEEDEVLTEVFAPLPGDEREEVSASTVLHDDLDKVGSMEGLLIADDVGVLHVRQERHLAQHLRKEQ